MIDSSTIACIYRDTNMFVSKVNQFWYISLNGICINPKTGMYLFVSKIMNKVDGSFIYSII